MTGPIDRAALVRRHNVVLDAIAPRAPLQVGNGTFAFAVDVTGLQTVPAAYPVDPTGTLLGTQALWGWHSNPNPHGYSLDDCYRDYDTAAGPVPYLDLSGGRHDGPDETAAERWLRANPHRLDLGKIGLWIAATDAADELDPAAIGDVEQVLDLWTGTIRSRFTVAGRRFAVATAAHPARDAVAVVVDTAATTECGLRLRLASGGEGWGDAADWSRPDAHRTTVDGGSGRWRITRCFDGTGGDHRVRVRADGLELRRRGDHDIVLHGTGGFAATIEFDRAAAGPDLAPPPADAVIDASARQWARHWTDGAAVELAGSADRRAGELERRIVLSQYLTAVNSSGSLPPAETGLLLNSWRGRFHLEMHWFHVAHFALWGRSEVVARQLDWYREAQPAARATARRQRLTGARWPKQVDPTGTDTPSSIGPFLVWQQPLPIYLAELLRRAVPGHDTLSRWLDIVVDTAELMAAFATATPDGFALGPPIVPAQESYHATRATARNPTFELALWSWALGVAIRWCERAGRIVPDRWRAVADGMAPPHQVDGVYAALATEPFLVRDDHPSMLAAFGLVPPTELIDPAVMGRTFDDVWGGAGRNDWDWESTWGWDFSVAAMCAARLGRPAAAVDALLRDTAKNTFLVNGHNRQSAALPAYLPGNGGLLAAIALMAAGWDGCDRPTPGFPAGWQVAHEGLLPLP